MAEKNPKVVSIRKERNSELIRRMRNGESLTSYDSSASWFPPRPVIEKDDEAISKLYGKVKARKKQNLSEVSDESNEAELTVLPTAQ